MFIFFFIVSVQLFAEKVIFDSPFLHSGNRLAFLIQDKKYSNPCFLFDLIFIFLSFSTFACQVYSL
jgi:hypothetical protein